MASTTTPPRDEVKLDSPRRALIVVAIATAIVTAISHADRLVAGLEPYIGTLVGATFLIVVWRAVLRHDTPLIRAYGLSLGGLTEPGKLDYGRIARQGLRALLWGAAAAVVIFPPFWIGYVWYWNVDTEFQFRLPLEWWDLALGQLLVVALPEEAFYRGYLQSALERGWARPRWRILGAELGMGWLVVSIVFAVGHYLALPHPARFAVFFPSLMFGWLRKRTGGVGAAIVFHTLSNLLVDTLALGYGH